MEYSNKNKNKNIIYPDLNKCTVAIIGLGYVGLPLAIEFAKKRKCILTGELLERKIIGFDINKERLKELKKGFDKTNEISNNQLNNVIFYNLTSDIKSISIADVFIISVPTPINNLKEPDLSALKSASITVGKALKIKKNSNKDSNNASPVIIFESTVYPGTTEDICVPIIEEESGVYLNNEKEISHFSFGYSPERINPGDKKHTLVDIKKITSGNNEKTAKWITNFYGSIIKAGIYEAQSIKVAEAAKIIENTQRDINIALVNEFAIIFKLMDIDTLDVINAASSKWNFIPFKPGLVGGHCIGVDPYYLTFKAKALGHNPEVVLAGRKINDEMSKWFAEQIILEISRRNLILTKVKILLLGVTFKENCPDTRNSKVIDMINIFKRNNINLTLVDPTVNCKDIKKEFNLNTLNKIPFEKKFDVVICAVPHKEFKNLKQRDWKRLILKHGFIYDLKGFLPKELKAIRP